MRCMDRTADLSLRAMSVSEGEPSTPPPGVLPAAAVQALAVPGTPCPGSGEAVDLSFHGSPSSSSPLPRRVVSGEGKGQAACSSPRERSAGSRPGGVGANGSFKDALLKPRTFKPRFPAQGRSSQVWYSKESLGGKDGTTPSVWCRLGGAGRIHGPAGGKLSLVAGGSLLEALKVKAGRGCYNCFLAGHRIDACRDPPRCLLCFRFGHKARSCRAPAASRSHSCCSSSCSSGRRRRC
jgi:hypothetical protein